MGVEVEVEVEVEVVAVALRWRWSGWDWVMRGAIQLYRPFRVTGWLNW